MIRLRLKSKENKILMSGFTWFDLIGISHNCLKRSLIGKLRSSNKRSLLESFRLVYILELFAVRSRDCLLEKLILRVLSIVIVVNVADLVTLQLLKFILEFKR